MPPTGRMRTLAVFFGRIIAVFAIMWLPCFAIVLSGAGKPWLSFVGGSFGSFQGALSAAITLTKPDIRKAVSRLIRCRFGNTEVEQSSGTTCATTLPLSLGRTGERSCNEVEPFPDLVSARHMEPFQNGLDDMTRETSTVREMVTEENNELSCWPE